MVKNKAAQRYVKALLGLAVEQGELERVHTDMLSIDTLCKESRPFVLMLNSPIIHHYKKKTILYHILKKKVHPLTLSMIHLITQKNRESLLAGIAHYFHIAYNEYKEIGQATVSSPVALSPSLDHALRETIKQISQKKTIELSQKIDPNLIGGFILDVEVYRIDLSIRNKLSQLKIQFKKSVT